jgi:hypothetical protein
MPYAAEESERLAHQCIGTGHLLLALLREDKCFASEILHERGLRLDAIREDLSHTDGATLAEPTRATGVTSTVEIVSSPAGAEIEVDGAFLGHTPSEVRLVVGERMVTITKKGYNPWHRAIEVLLGSKQTISVDLELAE